MRKESTAQIQYVQNVKKIITNSMNGFLIRVGLGLGSALLTTVHLSKIAIIKLETPN